MFRGGEPLSALAELQPEDSRESIGDNNSNDDGKNSGDDDDDDDDDNGDSGREEEAVMCPVGRGFH